MFTKFWKLSQRRFIAGHFSHHGFWFHWLRRKVKKHGRLGASVITPQILAIGFVILIRFDTRNQIFIKFMAKTWTFFLRLLKVKIGSSCFIFCKGRSSNTLVLFTNCEFEGFEENNFFKGCKGRYWSEKINCTTGIRTRDPSLVISGALPTELWCSCYGVVVNPDTSERHLPLQPLEKLISSNPSNLNN